MLLTFYEVQYIPPVLAFSNVTVISSQPKPHRVSHPCSSLFRSFTAQGDAYLSKHANGILSDLLGQYNQALVQSVLSNWDSKETSEELTRLYRLDEYVSWSHESPEEIKDPQSYRVGIWKAWWGCCFWEREVWSDYTGDLLSCLRNLITMKYGEIIQKYSTEREVFRECSSHHDPKTVVSLEQIVAKHVMRGDPDVCKYLGPARSTEKDLVLGYLATIGSDISIFETEKGRAESIASECAKRGFKSIKAPPQSL